MTQIAQVDDAQAIQIQQEENYKTAVSKGKQPVPTLIFIEEAHEFLSAQRIAKMQVLFQQVALLSGVVRRQMFRCNALRCSCCFRHPYGVTPAGL